MRMRWVAAAAAVALILAAGAPTTAGQPTWQPTGSPVASAAPTTMPSTTPTRAPVGVATPSPEPTVSPSTTVTPASATQDPSTETPFYLRVPVLAGAGCAIVVLLVVSVVLIRRRRWRNRRKEHLRQIEDVSVMQPADDRHFRRRSSLTSDEDDPDNILAPWEEGPISTGPPRPFQKPSMDVETLKTELETMKIKDVPFSDVQQLQAIETAHSSYHVRRGTCTAGRGKIKPIGVTIKSIEGPGTGRVNDALRELLREIAAVSQFNHSNVVSLIGVVWKGTPLPGHPLALYEHMSHGLLDRYLRKTKPSLERRLAMCTDVVSGVNYLASVNYVLGNLSAKIVMVHKDGVCKLGDFFISKDIADAAAPLPRAALSWYAPELYRQCDTIVNPLWRKSGDSGLAGHSLASTDEDPRTPSPAADIWALGMVLWEIWCNAEVAPYHKVPTSKIVGLVRHGHRPSPPPECPRSVYSIMIDCWHPDPIARPSASAVMQTFPKSADGEPVPEDDTELHEKYVDALEIEEKPAGVDDDSLPQRAPSPLIHMSLVGLKADAGENETVAGFNTLSSRPSNYTSESGSNPSLHSTKSLGPSPKDPHKDKPKFTKLFDQLDDDEGPLPPTLLRASRNPKNETAAVDGYLQISPDSPLYESEPKPRLTRSASARGDPRRPITRSPSPERRKSALALAMQGIGSSPDLTELSDSAGASRLEIPSWKRSSHGSHSPRRSSSPVRTGSPREGRSTVSSRGSGGAVSAGGASTGARSRSGVSLGSKSDTATASSHEGGSRAKSAPGFFKAASIESTSLGRSSPATQRSRGRASGGAIGGGGGGGASLAGPQGVRSLSGPASLGEPEPSPSPKDSAPPGGGGGKSGGWFKRTRRSASSTDPSTELTFHTSPEPGSLPDEPFAAPKPRRGGGKKTGREDDKSSDSRESPSPVYSGGLTLTASALHRIGRQLSDQFVVDK
eukprot:m.438417 g.438417  ORF g.438417 m.438417 type:complete len:958 (-) comp18235_c0_seq1:122-2995(-)